MKKLPQITLLLSLFYSCQSNLEKYGQLYQKKGELQSLEQVMPLLKTERATSVITKILGPPIDMGFDFRYLTEKKGENGCVIGAVFHIDEMGKVDDR